MKIIKKILAFIVAVFVTISNFVYAKEANTIEVYNAGEVPVLLKYNNYYLSLF